MHKISAQKIFILLMAVSLLLAACGQAEPEVEHLTIGVMNITPILEPVYDAFKEGLTQNGYIEDVNVSYIYDGPVGFDQLSDLAQDLVAQNVDMILAITTPAALAAQAAAEGTDIAIIFTPITDPVNTGMVKSLEAPGGNMTGVVTGGMEGPRLEKFLMIAPNVKNLYVPYNTEDPAALAGLGFLQEAADSYGVEIVAQPVSDENEVQAAIESIPDNVDGVFLLEDSLVASFAANWASACLDAGLPMTAANQSSVENENALMTLNATFESIGLKTADVAVLVLDGADPAAVAVQPAEMYLYLNLQTAQILGLNITAEILETADYIYQ